jgi:hypothetical protein
VGGGRRWTIDEEMFLAAHRNEMTAAQIGEHLDRSRLAVQQHLAAWDHGKRGFRNRAAVERDPTADRARRVERYAAAVAAGEPIPYE